MTSDDRIVAKLTLEDAAGELESIANRIEALRDGPMIGSMGLGALSANLRDASANLSLVSDGLRFA